MKKVTVLGHATVVVSIQMDVEDDLTEEEIYKQAQQEFGGIHSFLGNSGADKLVGVEKSNESIAADEAPIFDDFMEV